MNTKKAEATKQLEELRKEQLQLQAILDEPDNVRWRADYGEDFYYVNYQGEVSIGREAPDSTKKQANEWKYNSGNYFKHPEQAKAYAKKLLKNQSDKDMLLNQLSEVLGEGQALHVMKRVKFIGCYQGQFLVVTAKYIPFQVEACVRKMAANILKGEDGVLVL